LFLSLKPATTHAQRIITAGLIIPLLFMALYWGGPVVFLLLVWAAFSFGNREFLHLIYAKPAGMNLWFFWLIGTLALGGAWLKGVEGLLMALILGSLLNFVRWILLFPNQNRFFESMGKQMFALWYLPLLFPFFILIRMNPHGLNWIFFLLAVNYAGDTGAYYLGRTLGRHKLAPMVSPQKTVEGSLGGLAANILVTWIFQGTLFSNYSFVPMASLGLAIGVVSQVGDLLESMFKRTARMKDSGSLFPGHGGLLDRMDSLLPAAPVVYFFMKFILTP
jgi:phosphatidate cytidylyltransferase